MRIVQPEPEHGRSESRACLECGRRTSERKPYCKRHLGLMPYVQANVNAWRTAGLIGRGRGA